MWGGFGVLVRGVDGGILVFKLVEVVVEVVDDMGVFLKLSMKLLGVIVDIIRSSGVDNFVEK